MAITAFNLSGGGKIKTLTLLGKADIGNLNGSISVTAPKTGTYLAVERFGVVRSEYSGAAALKVESGTLLFTDCIQLLVEGSNSYCQIYLISARAGEQITLKNDYWNTESYKLSVRIYSFN